MYNKNLLYLTTTTSESVLSGGTIPLENVTRKCGCAINTNSNTITIRKPGYYKVTGTITFTGTTTGDVVISLSNVTGATSTGTVTTASTEINTLAINGVVKVTPCNGVTSLSLINTGIAITVENVALCIEEF